MASPYAVLDKHFLFLSKKFRADDFIPSFISVHDWETDEGLQKSLKKYPLNSPSLKKVICSGKVLKG